MHSVDSPPQPAQRSLLLEVLSPVLDVAGKFRDALELVVNAPGHALVERSTGEWVRVDAPNLTLKQLQAMALAVAKQTSQSFNESKPVLFGTLPTGERLTFVGPPLTAPGIISLTMRLVQNTTRSIAAYEGSEFFERYTWLEEGRVVARREGLSERDAHLVGLLQARDLKGFLFEAVRHRLTMGIVGDTGSGKTFLMEVLIAGIPVEERLLTVESARELQLPHHSNKVQLAYSHFGTGTAQMDAGDLMAVTKRMKPTRVLLGECIGPEAWTFLNMVISGHLGSITSWHTQSLAVARDRFILMCREHEEAKQHEPKDLERLFNLAMDVMLYIDTERATKEDGSREKRRWVRELSFMPRLRDA